MQNVHKQASKQTNSGKSANIRFYTQGKEYIAYILRWVGGTRAYHENQSNRLREIQEQIESF